ncbi:UDP-3-O-[3-hydroxymyristoyl] N-acetylglucosamine deacetylase [Pirellula sp. SH-Sr6A]|uniref:UDP-3-O-acyl-N-acetylglucosamine deacetylase n=1 Tax=Pirellula sp. SH-Sr6A TaxID=1632865 RepID=UPI00078EE589|nr:UDP-3-O-acyl-N-acetylglucosamine deacetylase [Pirellula sp. SH-Sr6A]AMV32588.1 UDP-3-O-[3-hydroxymyristoyl] N-acetylglucosamine deacetylase [Pirellula sp. SH-Sr6A]
MQPLRFQQTIEHVTRVSGRGYWSGRANTLTFQPAPAGTGIVFRRNDLPGHPTIEAHAARRRETQLRTTLEQSGAHVEMVEHVLAALYALDIDNCIVECDAPEMPGMDGSSLAFALAIEQAGVRCQFEPTHSVVIEETIKLGDDQQWIMAIPSADPGMTIRYELDYGHSSSIPKSESTLPVDRSTFTRHIAPARTFLEEHEAKMLQTKGIASHVTYQDLVVFGSDGPIDNSLRFDDECSRHKLLDVVGDLALCGWRIQGKVIAHRSGHRLNGMLAAALFETGRAQQFQSSLNHKTHVARNAA